jgi:hypothetical protein
MYIQVRAKGIDVPVHAIKARDGWRCYCTYLAMELNGGKWSS